MSKSWKHQERVAGIIAALKQEYPDALCALHYGKDYELMIAVRLSAQCTDARVNLVTPALFARYPDAGRIRGGRRGRGRGLCPLLRVLQAQGAKISCWPAGCCGTNTVGRCPARWTQLLRLPGVGRKTANLLLGDIYGTPGSVVCDTHCIRICNLLGLASGKDPAKVEQQLRAILPPEESSDFCHRLVLHGRAVCAARKPACDRCCLAPYCKSFTGE